jgi:hypothetical protein
LHTRISMYSPACRRCRRCSSIQSLSFVSGAPNAEYFLCSLRLLCLREAYRSPNSACQAFSRLEVRPRLVAPLKSAVPNCQESGSCAGCLRNPGETGIRR